MIQITIKDSENDSLEVPPFTHLLHEVKDFPIAYEKSRIFENAFPFYFGLKDPQTWQDIIVLFLSRTV